MKTGKLIRILAAVVLINIAAASAWAQIPETDHQVKLRENGILFQKPFQIAIDDLGWIEGSSLGDDNGPWRGGVKRIFDVKDYQALVDIGKGAGTRMQGLFILSEFDRLGILRDYPHMTHQQSGW